MRLGFRIQVLGFKAKVSGFGNEQMEKSTETATHELHGKEHRHVMKPRTYGRGYISYILPLVSRG